MESEHVVEVTGEGFADAVLGSPVPVLVDFWAPWCGPCRMVAPVLEELAAELGGRVRIATVDVDRNQELAYRFQVGSIPTFLLFKGGQVVDRMLGAMPKAAFRALLDRNL